MLERVDRIADHYERALRTGFVRSDAVRRIIAHGVDAVEAQIGKPAKVTKKGAK